MTQPIFMVSMQACECGAHGLDLSDDYAPAVDGAPEAYCVSCRKCGRAGPVRSTQAEARGFWNDARKNGVPMEKREMASHQVIERIESERECSDIQRNPVEAFDALSRAAQLHLVSDSEESRRWLLECLVAETGHVAVWKSRNEESK